MWLWSSYILPFPYYFYSLAQCKYTSYQVLVFQLRFSKSRLFLHFMAVRLHLTLRLWTLPDTPNYILDPRPVHQGHNFSQRLFAVHLNSISIDYRLQWLQPKQMQSLIKWSTPRWVSLLEGSPPLQICRSLQCLMYFRQILAILGLIAKQQLLRNLNHHLQFESIYIEIRTHSSLLRNFQGKFALGKHSVGRV